jgi:TonB family protein
MFEFAISKNQKRRPSSRIIITGVASCLIHILSIFVLVKHPELLEVKIIRHFVPKYVFFSAPQKQEEKNRVVTMIRPLQAPSAELLKKYMDALNKKGKVSPTVIVPLQKGPKIASAGAIPPIPKLPESKRKLEILLPPPISAPPIPSIAAGPNIEPQKPDNSPNKSSLALPPPSPASAKQDGTASKPPETEKPPVATAKQNLPEHFTTWPSEEKARQNPNVSGFIVPNGYPIEKLEKYVKIVIGQVMGKWEIPSNLKNSQGRITVSFAIDKSGEYYDIHIVGKGSGNKILDITALNAVFNATPGDPLPKDFPGDHLGAQFVFSYNEP